MKASKVENKKSAATLFVLATLALVFAVGCAHRPPSLVDAVHNKKMEERLSRR